MIQPHQDEKSFPAISIKGVTKRFRDKTAVDNLDLSVPRGSLCGFLGPNGAGKTTTIRMVMSIFPPDSGQISVLGRPTAIESKDLIGYLPEERGVYRKMKVDAFLTYIGMLKGVDRHILKDRINEWLERVELPGVQKKHCEELSKGMQQKIQFLATIIHDPELIILDEPFSGLDPVNGRLLRTLINDLHEQGKTIIFSTHVLQQAEQICDRIFLINNGKKLLDGTMDEIREQHNPRTLVIEPIGYQHGDDTGAIQQIEGIASVRAVPISGSTPPHMEAALIDGADHGAVLARVAQAVPLRRIESRRATLEDIFVSLVSTTDSEDSVRASVSAQAATMEGE
ncbi:MAG: ABC transporter ATP-binding protein [Phycisphaerales bacterium JB065]